MTRQCSSCGKDFRSSAPAWLAASCFDCVIAYEQLRSISWALFWAQVAITALLYRSFQAFNGEHGPCSIAEFDAWLFADWWED